MHCGNAKNLLVCMGQGGGIKKTERAKLNECSAELTGLLTLFSAGQSRKTPLSFFFFFDV